MQKAINHRCMKLKASGMAPGGGLIATSCTGSWAKHAFLCGSVVFYCCKSSARMQTDLKGAARVDLKSPVTLRKSCKRAE